LPVLAHAMLDRPVKAQQTHCVLMCVQA